MCPICLVASSMATQPHLSIRLSTSKLQGYMAITMADRYRGAPAGLREHADKADARAVAADAVGLL